LEYDSSVFFILHSQFAILPIGVISMASTLQLPRSAPEAQGIASSAILAFVEAAEQNIHHLHSLMLLRHGHVVAEGWWSPYAPEHPHMLYSLSKSFTATAIGLAVAEGRLSVDDPVLSFFPEEAPAEVSANLAAMRVRHLLSMSTGHATDIMPALFNQPDRDWVKGFLSQPVEHAPGSHFAYNSGASYMLSAIVQRLTGMTLLDYLRPRLLAPLGIEQATWEACPRGVNVGGWGLSITTDAIARFGQLYLQKGIWQGQRILTEAWIDAASTFQSDNSSNTNPDWMQGYGYQFWLCRHNAYRGDGAFGQFCLIIPEQDAVLAITAGVGDMQAVLDLVWQHLLPAFEPAQLPVNPVAAQRLSHTLGQLALPPITGQASSPVAAQVTGKTYVFPPNDGQVETMLFNFEPQGCAFMVRDDRGEHQIDCGANTWRLGRTTLDMHGPQPVAASGAWLADDTYVMRLCYYETPYSATLTWRFVEDRILCDYEANVSFGPTRLPTLGGRLT
jgi:CubicO group peptidase (beta-lactamase class C family)